MLGLDWDAAAGKADIHSSTGATIGHMQHARSRVPFALVPGHGLWFCLSMLHAPIHTTDRTAARLTTAPRGSEETGVGSWLAGLDGSRYRIANVSDLQPGLSCCSPLAEVYFSQ